MKLATFDRMCRVVLGIVLVFSAAVAFTSWDWFPTDESGDIASNPPNALNYAALLVPWLTALVYHSAPPNFGERGRTDD